MLSTNKMPQMNVMIFNAIGGLTWLTMCDFDTASVRHSALLLMLKKFSRLS
jgi:hypothetical protein